MSTQYNACPTCGNPKKHRAKQCRACYEATRHSTDQGHGTEFRYKKGCRCEACYKAHSVIGAVYRRRRGVGKPPLNAPDIIRSIDNANQATTTWTPPHLAPICPTCNGFGYTPFDNGVTHCRSCAQHPGRLMTHEAWTRLRVAEVSA